LDDPDRFRRTPSAPAPEAARTARWQGLVERYGRLLRAVIVRVCPRDLGLDFDDIEQEARLRLWNALGRESEITHPASYLSRIATTATLDAVRRVRARRESQLVTGEEKDGEMQIREESVAGADAGEQALLRQAIRQALAGLPAARRRAVGLHLQGFGSAEIGRLLGWSEPKARNLVYRGLAELRLALGAREEKR
jgi:RNA polymerase sigma factor (sigma-70 family)